MYTFFEQVKHQDIKTDAQTQVKLSTYLKFAIDPQTLGLLESEFTKEVLTIKASHVIPVPNKPSCILGILSRHRRVYWAVDLAMLLGFQPLDPNIRLYEVILISLQDLSLALIVPDIMGVVRLPSNNFENDTFALPETLKPYQKGYIRDESKESMAYLLKVEHILQSAILHS
ncbi:MAG: chemotaxis protein CheW [Pseudanabaena sp.]|jgi:positive phototaxis protein PixI|uniref:chemotaxis protein CheW n=1 Tax=Pseudanabaena mucicola TaxID=71190 RepID=UPI002574E34F|nr:chemotaxis protein CheW [Pseudanabaena mucicola]MCA6552397.1 chemotaxis protein CheW [Pseudanabaena sp. M135S2SP2A07QC]MCA6586705.1 chemotaxis protein CheW [Pseudanabaena sp. M051S1SP1A06QC]MCA6597813.1 chemotaxis protein CheW [Pseudanabaena sp. M046S1SP1A06QC]MCA6611215.1 chemotaxis protein CheW [Pseudanabaena sp. M158S2SP1A06QC]MCA6623709.1 chemotaxis protein CheW [Pseudanabaena sp. M165S2SP1A06QC]